MSTEKAPTSVTRAVPPPPPPPPFSFCSSRTRSLYHRCAFGNQHAKGAPIAFISLLMLTRVLPQTSKPQKGKKAGPVLELTLKTSSQPNKWSQLMALPPKRPLGGTRPLVLHTSAEIERQTCHRRQGQIQMVRFCVAWPPVVCCLRIWIDVFFDAVSISVFASKYPKGGRAKPSGF